MEDRREPRVPSLGHAGRDPRGLTLFRIEVEVEVLGPERLEFEIVVLDLVLTEVLGVRGAAGEKAQADEQPRHQPG
jgi:hypothetical protein